MANNYGPRAVGTVGHRLSILANGDDAVYKPGGATIDWATVTALAAETTFADDVTVAAGVKVLKPGQVVQRITRGKTLTLTISGSPTGGTFTLTAGGQTTAGIAYNANAATIETAFEGLSTVGAGKGTVAGTGPFTITLDTSLGDLAVSADGASLTGGTSPDATITATQEYAARNKYGPYDPAAADGREADPARGTTFLVTRLVLESDPRSEVIGVLEGGRVYKDRLIATTGTASLAAGPTFAKLQAALPLLRYIEDESNG